MGRVAGPAGLADHHVEAERREVVGVGVDAHVFGLVQDLGVGPAFVAGFGAGKTGIALNAAQRKRAGAAAEFEALKARSSVLADVVCHRPADFALRRHSSVARRSAEVIVLAIGKPSPRPCLESSQSPSGVPAARSTRTMAQ